MSQQAVLDGLLAELRRVRTSDPPGFLRDVAIEALVAQIDRTPEDSGAHMPLPLIAIVGYGVSALTEAGPVTLGALGVS